MFRTSPHPKPRRSPRTAAALTAGTALAAVTFLAGPAAAAAPQQTAPAAPVASAAPTSPAGEHEPLTRLICTESAGAIGRLPPESVPGQVCKLVNGWD
ncbi:MULTISPECIES: hypothetical protein [unclassified Streptomyces]|uniref:hypothetical protein n=1 Tax=unclassified Streptomyces TaxID=2593676 RepID=UPI000823A23E|nr:MULTISPECIES: hypothetical protein [unclassified Streptomyces]MYT98088.1 hypothetical protein [Streptomyces sp. SID8350]SCK34897.1 hypothetical protein YUWDRAFT_02767 [Streptomyces sp. AmelKG-D3]